MPRTKQTARKSNPANRPQPTKKKDVRGDQEDQENQENHQQKQPGKRGLDDENELVPAPKKPRRKPQHIGKIDDFINQLQSLQTSKTEVKALRKALRKKEEEVVRSKEAIEEILPGIFDSSESDGSGSSSP